MSSVYRFIALGSALVIGLAPGVSGAQTPRNEIDLPLAKRVAAAAAEEARRLGAGGALAIVDSGGHLVYLERLDRTFPAAAAVATEKARTAATFRRPTRDFEDAIRSGRHALLGVQAMTPLQGGVPIVVNGEVIGAIGVSGRRMHSRTTTLPRRQSRGFSRHDSRHQAVARGSSPISPAVRTARHRHRWLTAESHEEHKKRRVQCARC
jgi:uncharacterized protein GlcG (DUF336 family)